MTLENKFSGYKSFNYLRADEDYKSFELVPEVQRVKSRTIQLPPSEEDRTNEIFEKYVVVSLHDHPFVLPKDLSSTYEYIKRNRISTGYLGLSQSGLDGVFDGLLNSFNLITSSYPWRWDSVINELGIKLCDIAHQDYAIRADRVQDITRAHEEGRIAIIPHLEGASMIENDLDRIDILYGLGVRCIGLVYSEANMIGSGLKEKNDGGLTQFGYDVVKRFNKVGMTIDLAHVGDKTTMDAIEASEKPALITHSGCRALWDTKRMKSDEVLHALAERGGVLGIEAAPHTTLTEKNPKHNIEGIMEHFEKAVEIMGIDHVGFGPDTLFGDHVAMHHMFSRELGIKAIQAEMKYDEVEFVDGIENPSEFKNIVRWLVKNGYSDHEIEKVVGKNVLRVLEKTWSRR